MPSAGPCWTFGPFTLDLTNASLWRGEQAIALAPKAFEVLRYLVTHPNRLVTKDELLEAVWPETAVSEAVVRVAIGALRKALDDTTPPPHFIATVPRRGYRFLAPVTVVDPPAPAPAGELSRRAAPAPPSQLTGVGFFVSANFSMRCAFVDMSQLTKDYLNEIKRL
jgi:DNA-binding winged helix-turn-helix (wHTH) protein